MASLAQGIVGGDMAWPLVVTGILMGIAMIMFKVRSPMLVAIGMYLPIGTTLRDLHRRHDSLGHRRDPQARATSTKRRRRAWRMSACWWRRA